MQGMAPASSDVPNPGRHDTTGTVVESHAVDTRTSKPDISSLSAGSVRPERRSGEQSKEEKRCEAESGECNPGPGDKNHHHHGKQHGDHHHHHGRNDDFELQELSGEPSSVTSINLPEWIKKNSHRLKPPVSNYCVYNDGFVVMVVGGPNKRNDFHINPTPEWFYQHSGDMVLRIAVPTDIPEKTTPPKPGSTHHHRPRPSHKADVTTKFRFVDVKIGEGEMYLLPGGTPHQPIRFADTVGIVIEQDRPKGKEDAMAWFCGQDGGVGEDGKLRKSGEDGGCGHIVWRQQFPVTDLGTQVREQIDKAAAVPDKKCRTCGREWRVR